jgi:hypothetical protein
LKRKKVENRLIAKALDMVKNRLETFSDYAMAIIIRVLEMKLVYGWTGIEETVIPICDQKITKNLP